MGRRERSPEMMDRNYKRVLAVIAASGLTSALSCLAEAPDFPVTASVPSTFKPQVSIAADFDTLRKMAVSSLFLQNYRGIYRASGYEDVSDAHDLFPDLFVTLPDRSIVSKSKIRAYYQALFCSWLDDDRAAELLERLRLSNQSWIAYGATTIDQDGEQSGVPNP